MQREREKVTKPARLGQEHIPEFGDIPKKSRAWRDRRPDVSETHEAPSFENMFRSPTVGNFDEVKSPHLSTYGIRMIRLFSRQFTDNMWVKKAITHVDECSACAAEVEKRRHRTETDTTSNLPF